MTPVTRSQYAAVEQAAEQRVDTAEQEQEFSSRNAENTEVNPEEILAMLLEQKEIMKTQQFMQRKHIEELNECQRSQVAVIDNIRKEFKNEIKQINLKFAEVENKLDNKIELIHSEVIEYCKAKEEQSLETYTSLLASTLEKFKREMKEEFHHEICKLIDQVKLQDYIDGVYFRVPDRRKSETRASVPKAETSTLRDVVKPTQKPTAFDEKTSWVDYKTPGKSRLPRSKLAGASTQCAELFIRF